MFRNVCIFVPFMLLILHQGINTISLFRRYKKEQMAELIALADKTLGEYKATNEGWL